MNIYNHNDLFVQNKYTRWYYNIIIKAQNSNRVKLKRTDPNYIYYENHHVLPKSIFLEYENLRRNKWNGVLLTAREHYICHVLLVKMVDNRNKFKMINAFIRLSNGYLKHQQRYTSKLYEYFKQIFGEEQSKRMSGKSNPNYNKKRSEEAIRKLKESLQQTYNSPGYKHPRIGIAFSVNRKQKIKDNHHNCSGSNNSNYGKQWSSEWKERQSKIMKGKLIGEKNGMYNKTHSKEIKEFLSQHGREKWDKGSREKMKRTLSKGIYHTPWGNFISISDAIKNINSSYKDAATVRNNCIKGVKGFSFTPNFSSS